MTVQQIRLRYCASVPEKSVVIDTPSAGSFWKGLKALEKLVLKDGFGSIIRPSVAWHEEEGVQEQEIMGAVTVKKSDGDEK